MTRGMVQGEDSDSVYEVAIQLGNVYRDSVERRSASRVLNTKRMQQLIIIFRLMRIEAAGR